jgi:hypothetical protein
MRASFLPEQEYQMPIKSMTTTPPPGHLVHSCAACGAEHRISLDRAGRKSRTGPFVLEVGSTLVVRVDDAPPTTVTFDVGDAVDFARVTAGELVTKLNATVAGVQVMDDAGGVLLESASIGEGSRLDILAGTACAALGFIPSEGGDSHTRRPVLGVSLGPAGARDPSVIALRRCSDCGATEYLVRSFEASPQAVEGTYFAAHRKAVNSLAQHCLARGWSHPDVAEHHAAETKVPHDLDAAFPHRPCHLPPNSRDPQ